MSERSAMGRLDDPIARSRRSSTRRQGQTRRAGGARAINEPIAADLLEDLQRGRLSQTCKPCAITEAAGYSCTSCERPTGLADWYRPALSDAKRASLVRAHVARRNGSQMNHGPQGETYASATRAQQACVARDEIGR